MANTVLSVELELSAVLQQFIKSLQQASSASQQHTSKVASGITGITDRAREAEGAVLFLKRGLLSLGAVTGVGLGIHAIQAGIKELAVLSGRVEVLEIVSKNMGKTAGYTSAEIEKYVNQIKDLNITTQQANLSVTKFLQSDLPLDKIEAVARVARDTGVIMGFNTQDTLKGLVHGIITLQPEVLRTYGIITNLDLAYRKYAKAMGIAYDDIQQQTKQQIALNEVLEKGRVFAGTYETAMTKAFKRMTSLQRIWEEFKVSLGRTLQSSFSQFILTLSKFLEEGRTSDQLKRFFTAFADGANAVMTVVSKLVGIISKHPNLFGDIFKISVILSATAATAKLVSVLVALGASLFSVAGVIAVATAGAVTLAYYFGERLPTAFKVIIGALGVAGIAFKSFALSVGTAREGLVLFVGTLGRFLLIFAVVSSALSIFSDIADGSERVNYEQEQLESQVYATRMEFIQMRKNAIDLANSVVEIGSKTNLTKEESDELWKSYKRLVELSPNYVKSTEDQTTAVENAKKAIKGMSTELLEAMKVMNTFRIAQLEIERGKLAFDSGEVVDNTQVEIFRSTVGLLFSEMSKGWGVTEEQLAGVGVQYNEIADLLTEISATSTDPEKAQRAREELTALNQIFSQYSKLEKINREYYSLKEEKSKLAIGLIEDETDAITKAGLSADDLNKRETAIDRARVAILQYESKLTSETKEKRLLVAKKEAEQIRQILADMQKNYAGDTQEYIDLLNIQKNYVSNKEKEIDIEIALAKMRKEERNMRRSSNNEGTIGAKKLIQWYTEQMWALMQMGEAGEELRLQFEAARDALYDQMTAADVAYKEELKKRLKDFSDEMAVFRRNAFDVLPEAFLNSFKATNFALKGFIGTYASFMNTLTQLDITGKQRREAVWQDMLNIFSNILDQMIRRWVLFSLLTGLFRLPSGVASGALGITLPGQASSVRGRGTGESGDSTGIINAIRGLQVSQELSLGADRLSSTVTVGNRTRQRSKL